MPGIAGVIQSGFRPNSEATIESMLQPMLHEPFYRAGTSGVESLGLTAGWVAATGSFADCMPAWNEQRNICLLFTGEVYFDASDVAAARWKSHELQAVDARLLVHLYEERGLNFLSDLNGGFSGLLVDVRAQKLILFNDRYGSNRIYFHDSEDGFYFSSEAKSLLKVLPGCRQFDARGLGEFLSCGCVLQNRTLFSGVSLLPPGSAWTFRDGRCVGKPRYFIPAVWEEQPILAFPDYYDAFKETWRRILPRYFQGDEPVGLSLTGGVDSRMILAWAPRLPGTLPCYTFGGTYRECEDVRISREVARIRQQPYHVITVGEEFWSQFPALAEKAVYVSDGAVDVTGAIDLYVQAIARRIAPVRVTGTNGGEILRNLVAFAPSKVREELLHPELARSCREAAGTYAQELSEHPLSFAAFKQTPWYMGSKFVLERSQLALRMPYFDNDLIALAYRAPAVCATSNALSQRVIGEASPALAKVRTDRGGGGNRAPGLAHARRVMQEFTFRAEYAYDSGMPQWLATMDHMLTPLRLDRLFLGRHKFAHFRVWYRDQLANYVRDVLLDPRARNRPYLGKVNLEDMVKRHVQGSRNYTIEIHKLLSLEFVMRKMIEPDSNGTTAARVRPEFVGQKCVVPA